MDIVYKASDPLDEFYRICDEQGEERRLRLDDLFQAEMRVVIIVDRYRSASSDNAGCFRPVRTAFG